MSRMQRTLIFGIISALICSIVFSIFFLFRNSHSVEFRNYKRNLWLFNDSIKNSVDTFFYIGYIGRKDILCKYSYKDFNIFIWEFRYSEEINIDSINFNQVTFRKNLKFTFKEVLNKNNLPEISIRSAYNFNNYMHINVNESSRIEKIIESDYYKGFYGSVNIISLCNKNGKNEIYLDYGVIQQPTLMLLFKKHGSFYIIIINSDKNFDDSITEIFNFE